MIRYHHMPLIGLALVLIYGGTACGAPFVPTGVTPGSPYHLIFVTSGQRDSSSVNIADYNNFVNAQAANNPVVTGTNMGVQYFAVGSTTAIDASVNAPVTAPVYNFNDQLIATSFADLWDGTLNNAILYDEFGSPGFPDVWTGTQSNGTAFAGQELGTATPHTGLANLSSSLWIDDFQSNNNTPFSFYGLSQQLIAPSGNNVPEPSSLVCWTLVLTGLLLLAVVKRRRSLRQAANASS